MKKTTSVPEIYGSLVFSDRVMRERLPKDIYRAVHKTIQNGTHLELDVANSVAAVMKEWAIENGATHFTHWFQPMTGLTAESTTASSPRRETVLSSWNSPAKSWSRESRTRPASRQAD